MLSKVFPGLHVTGRNHAPSSVLKSYAADAASAISSCGLVYMIGGPWILSRLNIPEPALLSSARDNKMLLLGGYFMLNQLTTSLKSTGAFEVHYGEKLVWSKLSTGRPPHLEEVYKILARSHGLIPDPDMASAFNLPPPGPLVTVLPPEGPMFLDMDEDIAEDMQ